MNKSGSQKFRCGACGGVYTPEPKEKGYHAKIRLLAIRMPFQFMTLSTGAPYEMRTDKQETYSVEAINADLRHYLQRLALARALGAESLTINLFENAGHRFDAAAFTQPDLDAKTAADAQVLRFFDMHIP